MKAEILEKREEIAALGERWNELLRRSRADSLFLTWEWIRCWLDVAGDGVKPLVITLWDGGSLVGIAPFYLGHMRLLGVVPYRTLRILGDQHSGAEYGDWILDQEREPEGADTIVRTLAGLGSRWDCIWMPRVAGWTGAYERVVGSCQEHSFLCRTRVCDFSAAALPGAFDQYMASLTVKMRSNLRRQRRIVLGADDTKVERCESLEDLPLFLDALVDLNHRRWRSVGLRGTFVRKPLELAFYRRFTREALGRGWLRFFAIRRGGRFEAVQIGYVYGSSFHSLQEGFDPAGTTGLGNVLRAEVIERCIRERLSVYDFLGEHTDHKRHWRAEIRTGYDILIGRPSVKTAPIFSLGLSPTGRYLRPVPLSAEREVSPNDGP
jgi:CelD/BcsL family acetyltransferase involved in cellulose biosynthesis